MQIEIRPLAPALASDYMDFFENRAFTDGSPYRCYCQMYQMSRAQAEAAYISAPEGELGRVSREIALRQIETGVLRGYLAYDGGAAIGWCNVNDRANYPADCSAEARLHAPAENREKAVACFEIAPTHRGRGVATALLTRAVCDAKAEGYAAFVGFPAARSERFEWDFAGPYRLYEKLGFVKAEDLGAYYVMRRALT